MNADEFYKAMKEALDAFGLKWNEKDKMKVLQVCEHRVSFSYNGRTYGRIVDQRKENQLVLKRTVARKIWARNPCPNKNIRGHRSCSTCFKYAMAAETARK